MSESANDSGDRVLFKNVPGVFKLGENVTVRFELDPSFQFHSRDWVGLFRVGWTSNRDYYTFEWAPTKDEKQTSMSVTFSSSRLPPEDGSFYQFSYVSRSGVARGASRPFQFSKTVSGAHNEDLELVEVEEDASLLLLQSRKDSELTELQKKVFELQTKSESVETSFFQVTAARTALELEKERIENELGASQSEVVVLKTAVEAKEEQMQQLRTECSELKRQLQGSHQQIAELSENNAALKSEVQVLQTKFQSQEKEQQLQGNQLQQELDARGKALQDLAEEMAGVLAEKDELRRMKTESETQLRTHCNDLEEKIRSLEEEKESLVTRVEYMKDENTKLQEVVDVQNAQVAALEADVNGMAEQLGREKVVAEELQGQLEAREQECNIASENLCEMMGNITEPRDQLPLEQAPGDRVDMSVVNALQVAFTDIERRWAIEKKHSAQLTNKNAELLERIKKCKEEFLAVSSHNAKLHQQIKKLGGSVSGISTPEEPDRYQEELTMLQRELDQFHAKHDERIAEKNATLTEQQQALEAKCQEIHELQVTVQKLQSGINQLTAENASLMQRFSQPHPYPLQAQHHHPPIAQPVFPRPGQAMYTPPPQGGFQPHGHHLPLPVHQQQGSNAGDPNTRVCPICNTHFPKRIAHQLFEQHVNGHFKD